MGCCAEETRRAVSADRSPLAIYSRCVSSRVPVSSSWRQAAACCWEDPAPCTPDRKTLCCCISTDCQLDRLPPPGYTPALLCRRRPHAGFTADRPLSQACGGACCRLRSWRPWQPRWRGTTSWQPCSAGLMASRRSTRRVRRPCCWPRCAHVTGSDWLPVHCADMASVKQKHSLQREQCHPAGQGLLSMALHLWFSGVKWRGRCVHPWGAVSTPGRCSVWVAYFEPCCASPGKDPQVPAAAPLIAAVCPAEHSALARPQVHRPNRSTELARSCGSWLPEMRQPYRECTSCSPCLLLRRVPLCPGVHGMAPCRAGGAGCCRDCHLLHKGCLVQHLPCRPQCSAWRCQLCQPVLQEAPTARDACRLAHAGCSAQHVLLDLCGPAQFSHLPKICSCLPYKTG